MKDKKPKAQKIPKVKKEKTKKSKAIIAIILAILVIASSVTGVIFLLYQPAAAVNDATVAPVQTEGSSGDGGDAPEPHGYISQNVTWFEGEQALAINNSISSITGNSDGLFVTLKSGTAVDRLGTGDVFYLEGNKNTPIGEPYFGKVESLKNINGTTYVSLETPMIDEVFDSVYFQTGNVFKDGADINVETIEGVSVVSGATPVNVSSSGEDLTATPLAYKPESAELEVLEVERKQWKFNPQEELKFEVSVDLLKAFNLKDKTPVDNAEGTYTTKVYVLPHGEVYHSEKCRYLKAKETKEEKQLIDATSAGYRACAVCKPPILPEGVKSAKPELSLSGSLGIRNLSCDIDFEYDNKKGVLPQNCSVNVAGTAFGNVTLKGGGSMELGGLTTENEILKAVKIQGLKEKRFPFAYFEVVTKVSCFKASTEIVRKQVSTLPVAVLIIAYFDINGNVTFEVSGEFDYERDFNFNQKIVENGKANFKNELQLSDPEVGFSFHLGGEGDVDAHLGISLLVYIMNVNVLDIGVIKIGAESEGALSLTISKATLSGDKPIVEGSIYMRAYMKVIDIKIKLRYSIDIGSLVNTNGEFTVNWTAIDATIFSFGTKATTRYSRNMKLGKVTASDDDAIYYKDEDGRLIRQTEKNLKVLYDEGFFVICAIDESYIYILKEKESGKLSVIRVSKDKGTNKEVLVDVKNVLCSDAENIYYTSNSDGTVINKFNRETGESTLFCDFDDNVELMKEQNAQLYVVTSSGYSFFGYSMEYFYVDKNGNITRELGGSPAVTDYYITGYGSFNEAALMASSGYLRNSAREIYWLSSNKSKSVLTECVSGWNAQKDAGIFTTLNNDNRTEGSLPYMIVLYQAKDGTRRNVTQVQSNQAFFTLIQSDSGDWYFIDETDEELILYTMDKNFGNKQVLKRYSKSEIGYSLSQCSMEIKDNCLYFYTIDDLTCKVLKRYNVY